MRGKGNGVGIEKKTATQGKQGQSAKINYATGSGSRPPGGKFVIGSTAPGHPQMIRPKNTIGS